MNEYNQLTELEKIDLGERIASGDVVADDDAEVDNFVLTLMSGRRVVGSYEWGMDYGEFIELRVSP